MATRASTILICVPCLLVGGTEMHTLALARSLLAGGYQVTVCAYYEHDPRTIEEFERAGVKVRLPGLTRGNRARNVGGVVRLTRALMAAIRFERPDFVHVQYMTPGLAPLLIARWMGVKHLLATVHVTANHYGRRAWLPRRLAAPLCNAFICVSQVAEESFFGSGEIFSEASLRRGRRHFAIPNGIDLPAVDAVLASGPQEELAAGLQLRSRPVVGILGRLDRFKGHDLLLEAFAIVRRSVPDAVLLCVGAGAGQWRDYLLAETARLGLQEHVIWTGGLPQTLAFRHLMLMDLVVMPSRPCLEGFGLSAAEAMAFGKPVIASDVDGLAEVVGREGDGCLVPAGDVNALADAIHGLLGDAERRQRLGKAGRKRVEERFSIALFAERHLRLYQALADSAKHREAPAAAYGTTSNAAAPR